MYFLISLFPLLFLPFYGLKLYPWRGKPSASHPPFPLLPSPPRAWPRVTEPTTPRSGILLCEKLQTSEKKRIKSEAANRITPRVSRASKCVFAYEKVTGYMSTLGYMAQYINKSLFPRVASAYSGSPKETARSTHFFHLAQPYPKTLPWGIHLLRSDQDRSGDRLPRRPVWQPGTSCRRCLALHFSAQCPTRDVKQ